MTTFVERAVIQRDALLNPFAPDFVAPSDTTVGAVTAAVIFRRRLQSAMEDIAHQILKDAITNPPAASGAENERLIWAQKVMSAEIRPADNALRLILAEFDAVAPADLANVTDQQMRNFLVTIVPILARGIRK